MPDDVYFEFDYIFRPNIGCWVDFNGLNRIVNSLPKTLRKVIEKYNEDGFIQIDAEKALMLANAQGNMNM